MNWHAKLGAVLAIFDFSKKFRGRSCPQPFNFLGLFSNLFSCGIGVEMSDDVHPYELSTYSVVLRVRRK